jgi:hypothetical protein
MYYILVKSGTKEYDRLYVLKNYIGYKDKNSASKKASPIIS